MERFRHERDENRNRDFITRKKDIRQELKGTSLRRRVATGVFVCVRPACRVKQRGGDTGQFVIFFLHMIPETCVTFPACGDGSVQENSWSIVSNPAFKSEVGNF